MASKAKAKAKAKKMIIAIDGPAGAGKSTVAKLLAKQMGFLYIDTGAMYRALTLKAIRQGLDFTRGRQLTGLIKRTKIDLENKSDGAIRVLLDGEDVSLDIRKPGISKFVSDTAKVPGVRKEMLTRQRELGSKASCVLDGRDIGTAVFPYADKKFFLDADFKERVRRRHKELKETVQGVSRGDVEKDLRNRDTIDSNRTCAPLKQAKDAIYIDTTEMTIEGTVDILYKWINP